MKKNITKVKQQITKAKHVRKQISSEMAGVDRMLREREEKKDTNTIKKLKKIIQGL